MASATNLHFHGLAIPAACHADETLKTLVEPTDAPFEYRFQIPESQPPGLYWYHPHVHGISRFQLLGGASGALIVEGIERVNRQLAGLPERVFVVRDENLVHPEAEPPGLSLATQVRMRDPEGDMLNSRDRRGEASKGLVHQLCASAVSEVSPGGYSHEGVTEGIVASGKCFRDYLFEFAGVVQ